jgi:hypothetical protein
LVLRGQGEKKVERNSAVPHYRGKKFFMLLPAAQDLSESVPRDLLSLSPVK